MIKHLATVVTASLVFALLGSTDASAQASGNSGTTCTQSGQTVTCTTSTVFNLPSGVNLQSGSGLTSITFNGSSNGPTCTGLSASPTTVTANTSTTVILSVAGCPSGVNYAWQSPVGQTNNPVTSHPLTLAAGSTQQYSVIVCFDANPQACNTYQTSVSAPSSGGTPALSGCVVSPASTNLSVGGTVTLTASCSTGTGQAGYGVTYQWRKNGNNISGQTGSTYAVPTTDTAAAATLSYSVVIENNAPSTQTPSASVVVTSVTSGGANFCPGAQSYNATLNASETYKKIYSSNLIGSSTHWVVRIPVGAGDTTLNRLVAQLNYGEAPSNQRAFRKVSLSKNLCDYTPAAGTTYLLASNSNSGSLEFRINDTSRPSYPAEITTGTWYFNVQNTSCPAGQQCQALLEWLN